MSLAKYLFHKPEIMKLLMKRGDAIKAVRKMRQGEGKLFPRGTSMDAWDVGDKVVKRSSGKYKKGYTENEMRRRAHLKSIASDDGIAPETFLVDTKKERYLVGDKVEPDLDKWIPGTTEKDLRWSKMPGSDELPDEYMARKLDEIGMTSHDAYSTNMRYDDKGQLKILDLGEESMMRPVSTKERDRALKKFIQKNRKKDWL